MNKDIILRSNLLDIIFDGRNKEYGAYNLRKNYASRMQMALSAMTGVSIIFCVIALSENSNKNIVKNLPPVISQGNKLSPYKAVSNPAKQLKTSVKHASNPAWRPVIVHSVNINKLPATPELAEQSITGNSTAAIAVPAGIGNESGSGKEIQQASTLPVIKSEKPAVLDHADIMPEYPGGIKALLEFLKKNLHEPDDAADADDVAVKIKFVVNYSGNLEGFDVIQSGGSSYDNEVLRVLKKMPQWIPGKSNGENVSVYYIVPVHFTKQD